MKRLFATLLLSLALSGAVSGAVSGAASAQPPEFGPPIPSPAVQGLDGRWEGAIETPEGSLTGVFRILTTGDKTISVMDSPMQGVSNIPAIASRSGKDIVIEVPIVNGSFAGELSADGARINGMWRQAGMEFQLIVHRK